MAHVQLEITHLHHVAGEQYLALDPYPVDQGAVGAVMVLYRQNAKALAQKEGTMVAADAGMVHHDGAAGLTAKSGKAVRQQLLIINELARYSILIPLKIPLKTKAASFGLRPLCFLGSALCA